MQHMKLFYIEFNQTKADDTKYYKHNVNVFIILFIYNIGFQERRHLFIQRKHQTRHSRKRSGKSYIIIWLLKESVTNVYHDRKLHSILKHHLKIRLKTFSTLFNI